MFPRGLFCFRKCLHDIKFLALSVNVWEVCKEAADSWEKDAVGTQGFFSPWLVHWYRGKQEHFTLTKLGHFLKIQNEVVMHHMKAAITPKSMA